MTDRIRVLVVDDSAFNRRTITKMLEAVPGVDVIGYAMDGEEGLRKVFDLKPDLVTLDLEMPRMDGFTFLRIVMQNRPTPVIVVSARSEDENVFRALEFGAVEFVAKPSDRITPDLVNIREDLVRKVLAAARTDMGKVLRRASGSAPAPPRREPVPEKPRRSSRPAVDGIEMVVIGASTGGPPALQTVLTGLDRSVPSAFAIAQHMPPGFTRAFAERLNRFCDLEVLEAQNGDLVLPGRVLIAPGGRNLALRRRGERVVAHILEPEPQHRYVPSVDVLFDSAGEVFGSRLLGVVLTGMGNDGARGVLAVKERGGQVIAEAEETSVVFGMPKEAIATGKVDQVLPLPEISGGILSRFGL